MKPLKILKFAGSLAVVCLAAYGAYTLRPKPTEVVNVFYETDFRKAPEGIVGFPSFNAKNGKDFLSGATPVVQTSGGTLVLPAGAGPGSRVPAMVILHGSGGAWGGRGVNLAMFLARNGIAGLAVDTFTARDLRFSDKYLTRLEKAPIQTQVADGMSALKALQEHPYIDPQRIGVTGFSLGAASALYLMFEQVTEHVLGREGPRFSAYASFYGGCQSEFEDFRVEGSPVLLMMGELDESLSVERCAEFVDKLRAADVDARLIVYPGAAHGWDNPYPTKFKEGAVITRDCRMLWKKSGEIVELTTGNSVDDPIGAFRAMSGCANRDGYTMGFEQNAFVQSRRDLLNFLRDAWRADRS